MTQTIPQPVLDVIATYCKTSSGNIVPIIEHAIRDYAGGNPVLVNKYAESLVRAILHDTDPDMLGVFVDTMRMYKGAQTPVLAANPILVMKAQAQAQASPHAPQKRKGPRPPYWFKIVTSLDKSTVNGFGLKGKFVNHSDLQYEQQGRIVVAQVKDPSTKTKALHVLKVDANERCGFGLPNGNTLAVDGAELLVTLNNYADLFAVLEANHRIPT